MGAPWKHVKLNKPNIKGQTWYDSNYVQYLEQIHWDRKQNRGYQGLGGGENADLVFNGYRVSAWHDEKIGKQVIVLVTQPFYTASIIQCEYIYTEHEYLKIIKLMSYIYFITIKIVKKNTA